MSSSSFWVPTVNPPLNGEFVDESTNRRPFSELTRRDTWLYEQIRSLSLTGGRLVRASVPVELGTEAGDVVYWDSLNSRFAPAIAELQYNPLSGRLEPTYRSFVVGIAMAVNSSLADILIFGCAVPGDFPGVEFSGLVDSASGDTLSTGIYYLSRAVPGKITKVPSFPRIQLGFFSEDLITFSPRLDGFPNGHVHFDFPLVARPAASQNYEKTGWTSFGVSGASAYRAVDYFNSGSAVTPPDIILSVRENGSEAPTNPVRVELYRGAGDQLGIEVVTSPVSYGSPNEAAGTSTVQIVSWPAWGEWLPIPNTNLDVAFLHKDSEYGIDLEGAALTELTADTDRFKIFLPNDLEGWTNANPFDLDGDTTFRYRYLTGSNTRLKAALPPLPLEGSRIERNGLALSPIDDFLVTLESIYWLLTGINAPWPEDYEVDVAPAEDLNIRLLFVGPESDASDQLVTGLWSGSNSLRIERCPGGGEAAVGNLKIFLDLALGENSALLEGSDTSLVGIEGESLRRAAMVSELEAGPGILIERLDSTSENAKLPSRKVGKLRVSRTDVGQTGEFTSIALRGADEVIRNGVTYASFAQPSIKASSIVARFRIPNLSLNPLATNLQIGGLFLAGTVLGLAEKKAVFKATFHVIRPDFNVGAFSGSNALMVQYWEVLLSASLPAFRLFESDLGTFGPANFNESSLVMLAAAPAGLRDGDGISLTLERIASAGEAVDNYAGDIGLASLTWAISN